MQISEPSSETRTAPVYCIALCLLHTFTHQHVTIKNNGDRKWARIHKYQTKANSDPN